MSGDQRIVSEQALKLAAVQAITGTDFDVVDEIKTRCSKLEIEPPVMLKGIGYWDIFMIYPAKDLNDSTYTKLGPIDDITNSMTSYCFSYESETKSLLSALSKNRYAAFVSIKFKASESSLDLLIDEFSKVVEGQAVDGVFFLGSIGFHDLILCVVDSTLDGLVNFVSELNYESSKFKKCPVLNTFTSLAINHIHLPLISHFKTTSYDSFHKGLVDSLKDDSHLTDRFSVSFQISTDPEYLNYIQVYWRSRKTVYDIQETYGANDISVTPVIAAGSDVLWADVLADILFFRKQFNELVTGTQTQILTKRSDEHASLYEGETIEFEPVVKKGVTSPKWTYECLKKLFEESYARPLAQRFYTIRSLAMHRLYDEAFLSMANYPPVIIELAEKYSSTNGNDPRLGSLAISSCELISQSVELRSYGIHNNIHKSFGSVTTLNGGVQRAILALEAVPTWVFSRMNWFWGGFTTVAGTKFGHCNEVILVPESAVFDVEMQWAMYHEVAHIIIDSIELIDEKSGWVRGFLKAKQPQDEWYEFLVELAAELIGFMLGFFGDHDRHRKLLWQHLIDINPSQKKSIDYREYAIRSFFVEMVQTLFLSEEKQSKPDEKKIYEWFCAHINSVLESFEETKKKAPTELAEVLNPPKALLEKDFFIFSNMRTLLELYDIAENLLSGLDNFSDTMKIEICPPDMREAKETKRVIEKILSGRIHWDDITYPESVLYHMFDPDMKLSFQQKMSLMMTLSSARLRALDDKAYNNE